MFAAEELCGTAQGAQKRNLFFRLSSIPPKSTVKSIVMSQQQITEKEEIAKKMFKAIREVTTRTSSIFSILVGHLRSAQLRRTLIIKLADLMASQNKFIKDRMHQR